LAQVVLRALTPSLVLRLGKVGGGSLTRGDAMTMSKFLCLTLAVGSALACEDVTSVSNAECFNDVDWAMEHGITEHPNWYTDMPFLQESKDRTDFQYALAVGKDRNTTNCQVPCTLTPEAAAHQKAMEAAAAVAEEALGSTTQAAVTLPAAVGSTTQAAVTVPAAVGSTTQAAVTLPAEVGSTTQAAVTLPEAIGSSTQAAVTLPEEIEGGSTSTTEAPETPGMKWYWWVLITMGLCCLLPLLGLACSAFMCYESVAWIFGGSDKRSPQRTKKRAVKSAAAAEPAPAALAPAAMAPTPAPMAAMAPVQSYQTPLPSYQPATSYFTAPQARAVTYAAAPATVAAVPQYFAAAPPLQY